MEWRQGDPALPTCRPHRGRRHPYAERRRTDRGPRPRTRGGRAPALWGSSDEMPTPRPERHPMASPKQKGRPAGLPSRTSYQGISGISTRRCRILLAHAVPRSTAPDTGGCLCRRGKRDLRLYYFFFFLPPGGAGAGEVGAR